MVVVVVLAANEQKLGDGGGGLLGKNKRNGIKIKEENNRNRRGSRSIVGDAKRGSSGRGGRRTLGRDFGSCCEEGGFESRRGRSPGYPRKRSRRWVRARRGGCRRRRWSPGTPRRRSGGGGCRGGRFGGGGSPRRGFARSRRGGGGARGRGVWWPIGGREGGRDAGWAAAQSERCGDRGGGGEGYGGARRCLL
jgi:hypothetical protein